ncbi:indole-3-glycerol phosphate synthase TrpC [Bizionia paragorgiae]|jgi:indole-3-glycerol phosphate synthase|uniref:Indole-3-glycerol phosphate synthase n=1 Tax=Bizionia paragorgiae TaxID=283786 RepID=A0A1H3ZB87_BIZPA|nr:indole-3-glycerol phosphate synthase TrpC [Bizionia paragorgiae]MDX1271944.1 indole-3-glycerol phosphate synthase TrpC [Bizionia paragorgiae]SEA20940.1 indole-3-glycerol phosphate synthase [Bizionia paragorgiae]
MNILLRIVADKRQEVNLRKSVVPSSQLERAELVNRTPFSLANRLRESTTGIIAEHKRRSPSKNVINHSFAVCEVAKGYENAGASALSVLTDAKYFGGSLDDLIVARASCSLPILRKEFIIDTYQILEAKAYGADAILLIAAILTPEEILQFSTFAKQLGLDVLLEIHNTDDLKKSLLPSIDIIGVNNRDLKTFTVSLETSKTLSSLIPEEFVKISESGISSVAAVKSLQPYGFKGFLIGEHFMKTDNAGQSAKAFINQL